MSADAATEAQILIASDIYRHASISMMDFSGASTPEEEEVLRAAIATARKHLRRMGVDFSRTQTIRQCIEQAKELKPTRRK